MWTGGIPRYTRVYDNNDKGKLACPVFFFFLFSSLVCSFYYYYVLFLLLMKIKGERGRAGQDEGAGE